MNNRSNLPLSFEIKKASSEKYFQLAIHLLAIGAGLSCYLPLTVKAALVAIIVINCLFTLGKHKKTTLTGLAYQQEKGWQLSENGNNRRVRLLKTSVITNPAIVLHLEFLEKGSTLSWLSKKTGLDHDRQILIPADSLSPENYRRLAVALQTTWQDDGLDN